MATYERLDYGSADGSQWGGAATDKIAFFGAVPIVQRSGSAQVALTTALASVTVTGAYGFALSSGFSALLAQVEEIRAALVAHGLIAGA
jgi:hypothetical protein